MIEILPNCIVFFLFRPLYMCTVKSGLCVALLSAWFIQLCFQIFSTLEHRITRVFGRLDSQIVGSVYCCCQFIQLLLYFSSKPNSRRLCDVTFLVVYLREHLAVISANKFVFVDDMFSIIQSNFRRPLQHKPFSESTQELADGVLKQLRFNN